MSNAPHTAIALYYTEGSSDKVYQAQIVSEGDGFIVEFQYGRRGSALKAGRKTTSPVALDEAAKVFNKLVKEKQAKGYTEDQSGQVYQGTAKEAVVTCVRPMLLNPIVPEDAGACAARAGWCMQQKHDGERRMLRVEGGEVTGINRKGLVVALPMCVVEAALALGKQSLLLDGEQVGDHLHVWDVLDMDGRSLTALPLAKRLKALAALNIGAPGLSVVETWTDARERASALEKLRMVGAEGVVFKDLAAPYAAGRPASGGAAVKHKFLASATFRAGPAARGKRSVAMQMKEGDAWVDVGFVSVPANQPMPAVGAIAECTYLYAFRGGALFQATYKGVRADQDEDDCGTTQLQYKDEARAAKPRSAKPRA